MRLIDQIILHSVVFSLGGVSMSDHAAENQGRRPIDDSKSSKKPRNQNNALHSVTDEDSKHSRIGGLMRDEYGNTQLKGERRITSPE